MMVSTDAPWQNKPVLTTCTWFKKAGSAIRSIAVCIGLLLFCSILRAEEIDYQYDAGNRLIQTQYQGIVTEDYTYDFLGNRFTQTLTDSGSPANSSPNLPNSSFPSDGDNDIPSEIQLSWAGSDPDADDIVIYQVHFGPSTPPQLEYVQQETTSPVISSLNSFTTYYWQVVAVDNRNAVIQGPIWQFTTGNDPPYKPDLSQPSDEAQIGCLDVDLLWQSLGDRNPNDSITFDLYLGTSPTPDLFQSNILSTSFNFNAVTQGLDLTSIYYWQIVAKDNNGAQTPSDIWQFSFADADADGLPDDLEASFCTDPANPDSDDDRIPDGVEDANHNGAVDTGETNPCSADSDGDGIDDGWEAGYGTDPLTDDGQNDGDSDGFDNYSEYLEGTDPFDDALYPGTGRIEDFETGNFSKYFWVTGTDTAWDVTSSDFFAGRYAARSGLIVDGQSSEIETTVVCNDGQISFFYKVSSEAADDQLIFYIDGIQQGQWSGNILYTRVAFPVTAGTHTFKWAYGKGAAGSSGRDAAWIDDIIFPGVADSDSDGVIDGWEITYFGVLDQDLCGDSNGDGVSDLEAALILADPISGDADGDGMPDHWETTHSLDPNTDDAWSDADSDGYSNYDEFIGDSDPNDAEGTPRNVLEDFETGDMTKFYWRLGGDANWDATEDNPYQGNFSAQAPAISDSQSATMETTIQCIQGFVAFNYAVSSEADSDFLSFYIDDILQSEWSGDQPFQFAVYPVAAGTHTFKWEYAKNSSGAKLSDTAWIDNISFPGSSDSDNDGVLDGWEIAYFGVLNADLCGDSDGDGISDLEAGLVLADPIGGDTDGDGLSDIYESAHGLDPHADDAWSDADGDGYSNYDEFIGDSDPNNAEDTPRNVLEDFETGDMTKFYWRLGGDANWDATEDNPYQGNFSAQAPAISDSQSATMETTIQCIQGFVAFNYAVSSEADGDFLSFYIDDILQGEWSGDQPFQFAVYPVAAGTHTFKWEYAKNSSGTEFSDTAWIDNISFPGSSDSDNDGVLDGWEIAYFGTLNADLCGDSDGDGISDLEAGLVLADPIGGDTDGDGLSDIYESAHGLDPHTDDAWSDADGDGYSNYDEFIGDSDPNNAEDTPRNVLEDFETGDMTKFYWRLGGDANWDATEDNPYQGNFSAQAPAISDSQSATMETTIQCIQGFVAFNYAVSSEVDGDYLSFYIDDILQGEWSGDQPFQFAVYPVAAGTHTFKWEYAKNSSGTEFSDTAWIDNISFPGSSDSDNDGVLDGWEIAYFGALNADLCGDSNGDGVSDLEAALILADPISGDTDGDGMSDIYESAHGLDLNADDAWLDADGDGYSNYDEFIGDSDPNAAEDTPQHVLEDFETGDMTKFYWRLGGDANWDATEDNPYQGNFSAQAPAMSDDQSASMETTIQCIQGFVAFNYAVSSEADGDYLNFYIDDILQDGWSGDQTFQFAVYPVAAGTHTFKWEYAKNSSGAELSDTAWIDNISFPGSGDSDNDGIIDGWEQWHFGTLDVADQTTDADGDGLLDLDEYTYQTDPNVDDTDADGYTDSEEVNAGSDPNDSQSTPATTALIPAVDFLGLWLAVGVSR